ncbi:MAG: type I-F CRISPR-associated protein Csy1, partial [Wenzhouxiangella sp.]
DENFADDVVGNAAALDVFKFLKIEVEDRPLLDWMQANDPDLQAALAEDSATGEAWMQSFSSLVREEQQPASHPLAKQIYWLTGDDPTDDGQYHLLQPLFASSFTHVIDAEIRDARFGELNKLARQARRERKAHDIPYRDYRGLVVRKLGGTKPQNISQLNSERGGINYLLDSSPPNWGKERALNLRGSESALYAFRWFDEVEALLKKLQKLLKANPDPNLETRQKREAIERNLGQQLAEFGAAVRGSHPPGWTRDSNCRLPLCEQLWLDSERTELPVRTDEHEQDDIEFNKAYDLGNWPDEVAKRFGAWLNERLRTAGINTVGDLELRHWSRQAILDTQWPIPIQRRASGGSA